jgi:parallel beta-helix repeat protein
VNKTASATILVWVLCFSLVGFFGSATANPINMLPDLPNVYIRSDGSIEPADVLPIQFNGDTYHLTGDVVDRKIVVQRSNIVIDGNGFALRQTPIDRNQSGATEQGWRCAIDLDDQNNVTIQHVVFDSCVQGIEFMHASNVFISNNSFLGNTIAGIIFSSSLNVIIEKNLFFNDTGGIRFAISSYLIAENTFKSCSYGIGLLGGNSSGNSIVGNVIAEGSFGIMMESVSEEHVEANNITGNEFGIYLTRASNSTFVRNNFVNNNYSAYSGVFFNGTYLNPDYPAGYSNAQSASQQNVWNQDGKGNFYSDYNGTDMDHNSVGDTPYVIDENNQDNYPLISMVSTKPPYQAKPFPYTPLASASAEPSLTPTTSPPSTPSPLPSTSADTTPILQPPPTQNQPNQSTHPSESRTDTFRLELVYVAVGGVFVAGLAVAVALRKHGNN